MKLKEIFKNNDALIAFFILESLAITSFCLGAINVLFYCLGICLFLLSLLTSFKKFEKREFLSILIFVLPIFLMSVFLSFGNLFQGQTLSNLLVCLGINCFVLLGISSRKIKEIKPETVLLTIGFSIALLLFISLFATWINYGFFYAEIYKDTPLYYYDANMFDVTKECSWLVGFSIKEVSLDYASSFATLLTAYFVPLFFIKPKENLKKFLMYLSIGLVGLVFLLTIPNFKALIFVGFIFIGGLLFRFYKGGKKPIIITLIVFASLAFIFFILVLLNNGNESFGSFIAGNAFLNRIFNSNRIMINVNVILKEALQSRNFLGFANSNVYYETEKAIFTNTKMFEFELVKEGGLISLFFLIVFVLVFTFAFIKYVENSKDDKFVKALLMCLIFGFLLYNTFEFTSFPIIHESTNYQAFFRSPLTLSVLFLMGFCFTPFLTKKEVSVDEK